MIWVQMEQLVQEALELRKAIHKEPELGYSEKNTTEKIKKYLNRHGVDFHPFENMTGGYVYLDRNKPTTVGFRADIDALPIEEKTALPFCSSTPGRMHACGHDMHTAIAACLAAVLSKEQAQLEKNILIVFQAAEECNPDGGAKRVIEAGLFERFSIKEFYGLHMWPSLNVGHIAVKPGPIMAASDKFSLHVYGRNAHAAEPQKGIDAISIAADIINAITHKLRRETDPFDASLISIGTLKTSGRYNIICDHVTIEGTIRSVEQATREYLHRRIKEAATSIAEAYGGSVDLEIQNGYNVVINDSRLTEKWISAARKILGDERVHINIRPSLIGEDFSFYGSKCASLYFFMGCESPYPLHSDHFVPKEETLGCAVKLLAKYFLMPA